MSPINKISTLIFKISLLFLCCGYFTCSAMEEVPKETAPPATMTASPSSLAEERGEKGNLEALFPFIRAQRHTKTSPREIFYRKLNPREQDQIQALRLPSFSTFCIKGIEVFEPFEQDFKKLEEESLKITSEAQKNGSFLGNLHDFINFYGPNFSEQFFSLSPDSRNPYHRFSISHITRCFESPNFQTSDASLKSFLERGTCFAQKQDLILNGLLPNGHKIEIHVSAETASPFLGKIQGISYIGIPEMGEVSVYFHVHFPEVQALQFIKASKSFITSWPDPTPFSDWVYWEGRKMTSVEPKMLTFNRTFYDERWWENWTQYSEILEETLNLSSSLRQFAEAFQPALKKNPNQTIGEALLEAPETGFYETLFKMPLEGNYIFYPGPESHGKIMHAEGSQRWMRRAQTENLFTVPVLNLTSEEINFLNCLIPEDLPPDMYSCDVQRLSPSTEEEEDDHPSFGSLSLIWTGRNGASYKIGKKDPKKPYRFEVVKSGKLLTLPPFFKKIEEEAFRDYAAQRKQERVIIEQDPPSDESITSNAEDVPERGMAAAAAMDASKPDEDDFLEEEGIASAASTNLSREEQEMDRRPKLERKQLPERERIRFLEILNRQERRNVFNESHIFYHEAPDIRRGVSSVSNVVPEYKILEINREEWKMGERTQSSAADKKKEEEKEKKINLWEKKELDQVKETPWNFLQSLVTETGHYFAETDPSPQFTLSLIPGNRSPLEEVFTLKKHRWVESNTKTSLEESLQEGLCEITRHVTIFSGSLSDQRTCSLLIETSHQDLLMAKIIGIFYVTNPFTKEISVYFHADAHFLGGTYFVHASQTLPIKIENASQLLPGWVNWKGDHMYEVEYKNPTFIFDPNWLKDWVLENSRLKLFLLRFEDSFLEGTKTNKRLFGITPDGVPDNKRGLYKILRTQRFPSNIIHFDAENRQLRTVKAFPSSVRPKYSLDQVHALICMKGNSKMTPLNFEIPANLSSGLYEIMHAEENPFMMWKFLETRETTASAEEEDASPDATDNPPKRGIRKIQKIEQDKPFGFKMSYEESGLSLHSQVQETLKDAQYTPFLTELYIIGVPLVLEHLETLKQLRSPLSNLSFKDCGLKGDLPSDFFEFIEGQNTLKRFDFSGNPISVDSFNLLIGALSSSTLQEFSINAPRKKSSAKKRGAAGAFGGATSGAAAGFVVAGPVGAAAGGLIGAIAGGISGAKASDARAFAKRDKKSDFTVKTFDDIVKTWTHLSKLSIHNVKRSETGCIETLIALSNVRVQTQLEAIEIKVLPKVVTEKKALMLEQLKENGSDEIPDDWQEVEEDEEDMMSTDDDD